MTTQTASTADLATQPPVEVLTPQELRQCVQEVVNYLLEDEQSHYEAHYETDPRSNHIYNIVRKLNAWLKHIPTIEVGNWTFGVDEGDPALFIEGRFTHYFQSSEKLAQDAKCLAELAQKVAAAGF
jgi:hypothetical protein